MEQESAYSTSSKNNISEPLNAGAGAVESQLPASGPKLRQSPCDCPLQESDHLPLSLGDGAQSDQEALASTLGLVDTCSPPDNCLILIAKSAGEVATPHRLEPPDLSSFAFSQKWKLLVVAVFTAPQFPAPYTSGSTPGPLVRVYLHSECVHCFYEFGFF